VTLKDEAKKHNLDAADRPALMKGSALWECSFSHGHLATVSQLVEGIEQGIGTGSGHSLHVADELDAQNGALVTWTSGAGFVLEKTTTAEGLSAADTRSPFPFRCAGSNIDAVVTTSVPGEWAGPTRMKMEATDYPAATAIDAVDRCFSRGGHLPTSAELGEQILRGLPGGTGAPSWTSDQTGNDGVAGTLAVQKWSGVETSHTYGGTDRSAARKTDALPHRCVYYPVDKSYAGPTNCSGGCTTIALAGAGGAKMWFDFADRLSLSGTVALDTCRKLGGHLPSQRDLIEAIRAGLPNPTGASIFANDLTTGGPTSIVLGLMSWSGTSTAFDDLSSKFAPASESHGYRCMWTNELR
jgi:hypothetical protein